MSEKTGIAWCDSTLNFWRGCTKVSPGCANCYAEALSDRFGLGKYQRGIPRIKSKSAVKDALRYNKLPWICDGCGRPTNSEESCGSNCCPACACELHRRRIFSLSLGDWLDNEVPVEWLAEMLDTIRQCDQVTWILCTKRPELFRQRTDAVADLWRTAFNRKQYGVWEAASVALSWLNDWRTYNSPPPNITLLTSVENRRAQKRTVDLLNIPAACHGISAEPLIEDLGVIEPIQGIDWIIVGGESGPHFREMELSWLHSLVAQADAAEVPIFVKQDSGRKSGLQGRIPDEIWNRKEFPKL